MTGMRFTNRTTDLAQPFELNMIASMNTKIAVSVPEERVVEAKHAVETGRAASVSPYVSAAMEEYGEEQSLNELLDQWDAELGPPSDEGFAWAREQLGIDEGPVRSPTACGA
jgi:Arc/MetJ-type ribon-helix-helix transcriptional regulator